MTRKLSRLRSERGVGMIEFLIALVVVAVGVLGLGRAQIAMLKSTHSALLRSQATALGNDMLDRLRADRISALAGAYDHNFGASAPAGSQLGAQEVTDWLTSIQQLLPLGEGSVTRDGRVVRVLIRWDDTRGEATAQTFSVATEL